MTFSISPVAQRVDSPTAEGKRAYSPVGIPDDLQHIYVKATAFDLEIVEASSLLESEDEYLPEDQPPCAGRGGGIPSFASTISDLEYPEYNALSGCSMFSQGPRETASWNATATDFDNLTSPGAQAEQSSVYRDALGSVDSGNVHSGAHAFQQPSSTVPLPTLLPATCMSSGFHAAGMPLATAGPQDWIDQNGLKAAETRQPQAEELERAQAAKVVQRWQQMQAMQRWQMERASEQQRGTAVQAKAAASHVQAQGALVQNLSSTDVQKPRMSLWESLTRRKSAHKTPGTEKTTVMLRNLPNGYSREMLLHLLNSHDLAGQFDFVYLPVDIKRRAGLGYAFVNMTSSAAAQQVFATMQGFSAWEFASSKVLDVSWGEPLQGLDAHIDRYRNSHVMHPDVPEAFRPLLFERGMVVPFPEPTKQIQKPRMKPATSKA